MAMKVQAQAVGGEVKSFDGVNTVADVRAKLGLGANYQASINGEPADNDTELNDFEYVSFAPQVKGA